MFSVAFPGDSSRVISDLKFKLVKAEQEATASEQNVSRGGGGDGIRADAPPRGRFHNSPVFFAGFQVARLEGQVMRYKTAAENAEKVEDELKAEKRKLQREVAGRPEEAVWNGGLISAVLSLHSCAQLWTKWTSWSQTTATCRKDWRR